MVGVSGFSKGCRTCRRRRVKCDERHPSCMRCEKSSLDCEGFGRDINFVSENSNAKRRSLKQEALRAKSIEEERSDRGIISTRSSATSTPPARILPVLNCTAFKTEIQISFTLAKLFGSDERSVAWLVWGYDRFGSNINTDALRALSGVYYGRLHHESSIEKDGRIYYSRTLRAMRKAIEPQGGVSLAVLLAGMTALCYEMIASPSHMGILLHAGGIGRLIELRGPEKHCDMFGLNVLTVMRNSICLKAMIDRKRCFLEREEWKSIPWSLHSEEKIMVRWVEDIMCDIPGLFEDYDSLITSDLSPKTYQLHFENLKAEIIHHLQLLADWRTLWEKLNPGTCHEQPTHYPQSPFSTVLHYQDLESVNGLILYNALYIITLELATRLLGPDFNCQQVGSETEFQCTNPCLNPPGASLHDAAIEICRSIEYYFLPPHESHGAFFITFPMKKASDVLPSGSAEQEWLKVMMINLAATSGFLFSQGVLS